MKSVFLILSTPVVVCVMSNTQFPITGQPRCSIENKKANELNQKQVFLFTVFRSERQDKIKSDNKGKIREFITPKKFKKALTTLYKSSIVNSKNKCNDGTGIQPAFFQRAAGRCEAAKGLCSIIPEQAAEPSLAVGAPGFPPLAREYIVGCTQAAADAASRVVPRKFRLSSLVLETKVFLFTQKRGKLLC